MNRSRSLCETGGDRVNHVDHQSPGEQQTVPTSQSLASLEWDSQGGVTYSYSLYNNHLSLLRWKKQLLKLVEKNIINNKSYKICISDFYSFGMNIIENPLSTFNHHHIKTPDICLDPAADKVTTCLSNQNVEFSIQVSYKVSSLPRDESWESVHFDRNSILIDVRYN